MNRRVLITGGAGFVGSHLALALKRHWEGATVVCLDNFHRKGSELNQPRLKAAGIEVIHGDVREPHSFPPGPFETIVECSAEPSVLAGLDGATDYLYHTNLTGAYHCLEWARRWQSTFLFLSTSRVYPIARLESHPWRELETRFAWEDSGVPGISARGVSESLAMDGPRSLYGFTKYAAENLIEEYRAAFGLRTIVNRCGVIAGPWQFGKVDQGVAALWVLAHHFGRPLKYVGFGGSGKQVRDFLHIDDLCELVIEQLTHASHWDGWVGNVAGGLENSASLRELTKLCQEFTGRPIAMDSLNENRPADLRLYIGDCQKLAQRTPWRPQRNVPRIIADIAAWVREHENVLKNL